MAYSLKHRLVSWVSRSLFDGVEYTVRNGLNKGLKRRGGLGWLPFEQSNPEIEFWKSLDLSGKVVYDVGAFHGLLTIYFARSARQVVAWEPTAYNRQRLLENVKLNGFQNVVVRPYGLASRPAQVQIAIDENEPGTASVDANLGSGTRMETIEIRTLDQESGIPRPDFIKIDTEGFELEVLMGGPTVLVEKPDLFLEMHGAGLEDKKSRVGAIVAHLIALGYHNILHVESGNTISSESAHQAAQGHLYARAQ